MHTRNISLPLLFLFPVVLGVSVVSIIGVAGVVPEARPAILGIVAVVMAVALPAVVLKPVNLALLKAIGGTAPHNYEWWRCQPLLASIEATANHDGYPLLLSRYDNVFSDIGCHAVTLPHVALEVLTVDELRALLSQRVRRQENLVSPMLGLCAWAALPLVFGLGLAYVVYKLARFTGQLLNGVADGMKPRSEAGAAVGLLLYLGGFIAFVAALAVSLVILYQGLVATVVLAAGAWVFRLADLRTTSDVVRFGLAAPLRSALITLDATRPRPTILRSVFSARASLEAHVREISATCAADTP